MKIGYGEDEVVCRKAATENFLINIEYFYKPLYITIFLRNKRIHMKISNVIKIDYSVI